MITLEISRMTRPFALGMAALVIGLFPACGAPSEEPADVAVEETAPAEPAAPAEEAAPAEQAAPAPEAAAGTGEAAPAAAGGAGDAAKGKTLYVTYCGACHGPGGKGDGPAAATLTKKPADHTDGSFMNPLATEELFKAIKEGGAAVGKSNLMPAWGATLSDDQIHDVLAYVRSLAVPPYPGE